MLIVNPLYDKAFKYLMENERLAQKVLSVILDKEVLDVKLGQQETTLPDEKRGFTLYRLDFKATIVSETGKKETVLIELQKSKFETDIQRFRAYLGSNYLNKDKSRSEGIYPIITIYILGYKIEEIPHLAVTVNRNIIDSVSKEQLSLESPFIEHLTHTSHILQIGRLPKERKSRLERFLSFFNQAWCTNENYILDLEEVPEEFTDIAQYLQGAAMDEEFRRLLDAEEEIDFIFDNQERKYLKKIEDAEASEREAILREKEAEKREKEAQEREREAQVKEKDLAIKMAKLLKAMGKSAKEISEETGLSEREIEKL